MNASRDGHQVQSPAGTITGVVGSIVDVEIAEGPLPFINQALDKTIIDPRFYRNGRDDILGNRHHPGRKVSSNTRKCAPTGTIRYFQYSGKHFLFGAVHMAV